VVYLTRVEEKYGGLLVVKPTSGTEEDWKSFGQYFTPRPLSLIAAAAVLRGETNSITVLDPSCGEGHMLSAVREMAEYNGQDVTTIGVELDPIHASTAKKNADNFKIGDAFLHLTSHTPEWIPEQYTGLVGNPPYIRLDGKTKRTNRLKTIADGNEINPFAPYISSLSKHCSGEEKWSQLVSTIGGRADISLPFWFLSVLNLKPGHRLAIVTSDAWRTRNYGLIQRALMVMELEIEVILKQPRNIWFPETQTSTSLVIAQRINPKKTNYNKPIKLVHVHDDNNISESTGLNSISKKLGLKSKSTVSQASEFVEFIYNLENSIDGVIDLIEINKCTFRQSLLSDLKYSNDKVNQLLIQLLTDGRKENIAPCPPSELLSPLNSHTGNFDCLGEMIYFRQGLRTGCDRAYYCEINDYDGYLSSSEGDEITVSMGDPLNTTFKIPKMYVKRCVQGQSNLGSDNKIAIIVPGKSATKADFEMMLNSYPKKSKQWIERGLHLMPEGLQKWVKEVEKADFGTDGKPKMILNHVVQKSNVNEVGAGQKLSAAITTRDFPSWWYTLNLKSRHTSPLFFPRVNNSEGGELQVSDDPGKLVISANFTTIVAPEDIPTATIAAITRTEWFETYLEINSTAMGGGALKVEKTHLQRLVIPKIDLTNEVNNPEKLDGMFAKSLGIGYQQYTSGLKRLKHTFRKMRR